MQRRRRQIRTTNDCQNIILTAFLSLYFFFPHLLMQCNVCVVNSSLKWEPFLRADNVLLVISAENQVQ